MSDETNSRLGAGALVATAVVALAVAVLAVPACSEQPNPADASVDDSHALVFTTESEGVVYIPPTPAIYVCPRGHRAYDRFEIEIRKPNGTTMEWHACGQCWAQWMERNFPAEGRRRRR